MVVEHLQRGVLKDILGVFWTHCGGLGTVLLQHRILIHSYIDIHRYNIGPTVCTVRNRDMYRKWWIYGLPTASTCPKRQVDQVRCLNQKTAKTDLNHLNARCSFQF